MSFYRWSCRFVRPWFCRELSLREKEARRIFEFSACQQPRWGSMVSRKTSEIVVVYLHLPKIKSDGRTEMWMEDGQGSRTPASLSSLVQPNVTIAET